MSAPQFPSPAVKLPDCQLNWENLRKRLDSVPLLAAAADRKIAFGVQAVPFNGSQQMVDTSIAHGLGTTPVVVLATSISGSSFLPETFAYGASNFTLRMTYAYAIVGQTPVANNYNAVWLAIG